MLHTYQKVVQSVDAITALLKKTLKEVDGNVLHVM